MIAKLGEKRFNAFKTYDREEFSLRCNCLLQVFTLSEDVRGRILRWVEWAGGHSEGTVFSFNQDPETGVIYPEATTVAFTAPVFDPDIES